MPNDTTINLIAKDYTIFDLGYNRDLIKEDDFYDQAFYVSNAPLQNVITSFVSPSLVASGELGQNVSLVSGHLQSSNFVTGSTGWQINSDGSAEFASITLTGGTIKYGKTAFSDSTNAGYWIGSSGMYFGAASDANYLKYDIGGATFTLYGVAVTNPTITNIQSGSEISIQGWQSDLVFSASDADTVAWASGTITLMDGTTYSITGANTGNMSALTYIYLDVAASTTVLQTTTTAATAVGSGKILIAVAENSTTEATFQVFGGKGGIKIKGGEATNTGATSPGTMADDDTVGTIAWSSPDSAKALDSNYAFTLSVSGEVSHYLKATNFGFSVPSEATIKGIKTEINQADPSSLPHSVENSIKIVKGGTIQGDEKSTGDSLPSSDTYVEYGSSSDLWGLSWTPSDINNANFGVVFSIVSGDYGARADHIRITVYYTITYNIEANSIVGGTSGNIAANTISANEIVANTITASELTTGAFVTATANISDAIITNAKIADLAVDKLTAGTITSKTIALAIAAGTGDTYIAAGKTDFTNTDNGFILGLDDSDSDKAKLYIGDSTHYFNWTGSAVDVYGATVTAGIVQTASGTGKRVIMDGSDNSLKIYDASNNKVVDIGATASVMVAMIYPTDATSTNTLIVQNGSLGRGIEVSTDNASNTNALIYASHSGTGTVAEFRAGLTSGRTNPAVYIMTRSGQGAHLNLDPIINAPGTPSEGDIYADTDHHLYYYNGSAWVQLDN